MTTQAAIETDAKYNYIRNEQRKIMTRSSPSAAAPVRARRSAAADRQRPHPRRGESPSPRCRPSERPRRLSSNAGSAAGDALHRHQRRRQRRRPTPHRASGARSRDHAGARARRRAAMSAVRRRAVAAEPPRRVCRSPSRAATACWCAASPTGVADCVYRTPGSPMALAEARRYLRLPLKLTPVDARGVR